MFEQKSLEAVEKDLVNFAATLKTDPRLADFLKDPSIKKSVSFFYLSDYLEVIWWQVLSYTFSYLKIMVYYLKTETVSVY